MSTASGKLTAWVRLGRPKFLAGGALAYGAGAALAARSRPFDAGAFVIGLCAIAATQLMTHYGNDYFDLSSDRANLTPTRWSGGSRVLPKSELQPRVALWTALACAAIALALDAWAARETRPTPGTFGVLVAALLLAWEYSAPPLRLHSHGWGALTAAAVVGLLTPLAGYGMQSARWCASVLVTFAPLAIAQFVMILAVDFPDVVGDRAGGKQTVAVRFGEPFAAWLCVTGIVAAYAILAAWPPAGMSVHPGAAHTPRLASLARWAWVATLPLGLPLVWTLVRASWKEGAGGRASIAQKGAAWLGSIAIAELLALVPWSE